MNLTPWLYFGAGLLAGGILGVVFTAVLVMAGRQDDAAPALGAEAQVHPLPPHPTH